MFCSEFIYFLLTLTGNIVQNHSWAIDSMKTYIPRHVYSTLYINISQPTAVLSELFSARCSRLTPFSHLFVPFRFNAGPPRTNSTFPVCFKYFEILFLFTTKNINLTFLPAISQLWLLEQLNLQVFWSCFSARHR